MSDSEHSSGAEACGADVAAYALGALSPAEAAAFELHLATCTICSEELAAFQKVVDAMPLTVEPQRAPRALRRRVMAKVNQEAVASVSAGRRQTRWTALGRGASARPLAAASAFVAAAVIAVGAVELAGSGSNTRVYHAQVTGHGSAEVTVSGAHADLVVRHFAAPPKGHIYEVWLERPGKAPVPANALFDVTAAGDGGAHLPVQVRSGDQILVTAEPPGGSGPAPTTTPVLSVKLS